MMTGDDEGGGGGGGGVCDDAAEWWGGLEQVSQKHRVLNGIAVTIFSSNYGTEIT